MCPDPVETGVKPIQLLMVFSGTEEKSLKVTDRFRGADFRKGGWCNALPDKGFLHRRHVN